MAGHNLSTLSALLQPNVQSSVIDLQCRKADLVDLLRQNGRIKDSKGSAPFKWNVVTATNSSAETFSEGQAPSPAGRQTYVQASVDVFGVRVYVGETGHTRDNRAKSGFYDDPGSLEEMLGESDLLYKADTELCGSTQDRGIASIIDSTGTYAGLAQGTYSVWSSEENAVSGALTVSALNLIYEELTLATNSSVPRGASPTHVLMPVQQITNYTELVGPAATSGGVFRYSNPADYDLGLVRKIAGWETGLTYNGLPLCRIRNLTSTEIYVTDITDWELLIHRDLQVDPVVGNPEVIQYQLSTTMALKIAKRNHHGKMTGVTA